jgi:aminoglycoside phosphotransferase (APT) family kinase protein
VTTSSLETPVGTDPTTFPCPRTGLWALCSVEQRLKGAGFVLRRVEGEAPRRAGFGVRPVAYTLAHSRLEVFIYPTASALSADVAKIDTVKAAPPGAPTEWETTPIFVHSGNLAVIFLTENGTQAERLTLALTAGAPQR